MPYDQKASQVESQQKLASVIKEARMTAAPGMTAALQAVDEAVRNCLAHGFLLTDPTKPYTMLSTNVQVKIQRAAASIDSYLPNNGTQESFHIRASALAADSTAQGLLRKPEDFGKILDLRTHTALASEEIARSVVGNTSCYALDSTDMPTDSELSAANSEAMSPIRPQGEVHTVKLAAAPEHSEPADSRTPTHGQSIAACTAHDQPVHAASTSTPLTLVPERQRAAVPIEMAPPGNNVDGDMQTASEAQSNSTSRPSQRHRATRIELPAARPPAGRLNPSMANDRPAWGPTLVPSYTDLEDHDPIERAFLELANSLRENNVRPDTDSSPDPEQSGGRKRRRSVDSHSDDAETGKRLAVASPSIAAAGPCDIVFPAKTPGPRAALLTGEDRPTRDDSLTSTRG